MILLKLASKSLFNRKASVLLSVLTIAISVMMLLSIERVRVDAKSSFANTISGTDLIVGARTGDIQLLLASVFRIGHMNNGVSWQSYQAISSKRGVAWSIPLSLGDAHKGFAVIGTDLSYFEHFRYAKKQPLRFAQGHAFAGVNDVVLGADVARSLDYQLGDNIVVAHGMGNTSFHQHDDNPLTIVGILAPTGTPVDKSVHVPLKAIELMHGSAQAPDSHEHEHEHEHDEHTTHPSERHEHDQHHEQKHAPHQDLVGTPKQISAFLLGFDSPLFSLQVRHNINQYQAEPLMAIMPTVTLSQLWEMLAIVEKILLLFSLVVVSVSLLGMLTTLLANLSQRRRELAILRSVGAKPWHIFSLMSMEAVLISVIGTALGCGLFYAGMWASQSLLQAHGGISLSITPLSGYELSLVAGIIIAGWIVGILPAARAYFYSLNDGMSIKT